MLVAGGKYVNGELMVFERWDVRETREGICYIWKETYDIELFNDGLALLIATPVINFN
jgi:hypothetical protein